MKTLTTLFALSTILVVPTMAMASAPSPHGSDIVHRMMILALQIGIIIFVAKFGGILFEKLRLPSVLGELVAGIFIGPYMLGGISLPGFDAGLFGAYLSAHPHAAMPVSPELYGLATVASVLLLFAAGLETDLKMFLRFSLAGSLVGCGGVLFSFAIGAGTASWFMNVPFMDPTALFLGVLSTATSVGITARILSERKKMSSPEGVTIISGAVIDDVLGIIALAIVLGIVAAGKVGDGHVHWGHIGIIAAKAIAVWLGFTIAGLLFADKISKALKAFTGTTTVATMALGLAFLMAGIFEQAGLAMIIGAYIMGLTLSKTDLNYAILQALHPVEKLLVPIFFVVSGMLVNPLALTSKSALLFAAIYSIGAIAAKIVGCAIPSYFLKFNTLGALRIGLGMVPRGEVALIIASIGLSNGILDSETFGVAILMTLVTTLIGPPILNSTLKLNKKGLNKNVHPSDYVDLTFHLPSRDSVDIVLTRIITSLKTEGFFVNEFRDDEVKHLIRRDDIFLSITPTDDKITIEVSQKDVSYIETLVYESLVDLKTTIEKLQNRIKPESIGRKLISTNNKTRAPLPFTLEARNVILNLKANTKNGVIEELVTHLERNAPLADKNQVLTMIMEREKSMSTGMQHGIAIPHARCPSIKKMRIALGIHTNGVDFDSIDGAPCHIIVLMISREDGNDRYIQTLAALSSRLSTPEKRSALLACRDETEVVSFFNTG